MQTPFYYFSVGRISSGQSVCVDKTGQVHSASVRERKSAVLKVLESGQDYYVQMRFVKEKYAEAAPMFLAAYQWYVTAASQYLARPKEAQSAVWAHAKKGYAASGAGGVLLSLQAPKEEMLLFVRDDWTRILNAQFLGSENECAAYENELKRAGIRNASTVCTTAFYPLQKRRLQTSWQSLFSAHERLLQEREALPQNTQAGLWRLSPTWIKETYLFGSAEIQK